jgi:prepilin-type N-terminal cleavage/methylation domain-containing protein
VRRAITSRSSGAAEDGFTLVELLVTAAIMSIVSTAVIAMAMRVVGTSSTIVDRRDVLADGRIALDRMGKQLRQAESVDTTYSCGGLASTNRIKVPTYIDGTPATVVWIATGPSGGPFVLSESVDGGTTLRAVITNLKVKQVFKCTKHGGLTDQVTINLHLGWPTSVVELTSDVYLRNAT